MITVENLVRNYGRQLVLDHVTFDIPIGKIIGLAGENGSGKSTLLQILAGVLKPTSGSIQVDGELLTRRDARTIAYLTDLDLFYPNWTGHQLFHYYGTQFDDFQYKKACAVAEFLKISLDAKLGKLSKGNRGRVKMAATLGREATYYLMDEPFSGFDPLVREDLIKGLIHFTNPETQTILLSTHEVREVEPLLDEILVLHKGQIIAYEEVEQIREKYAKDTVTWLKNLLKEGVVVGA